MEEIVLQQKPIDKEIIDLAARDGIFFGQCFFPDTCRQAPATIHPKIWNLIEKPQTPFVGIEVFREGAKTSILRLFTMKRIAYRISRTIFYTSITQDHAIRSLRWIKRQITTNKTFAKTFHLSKGDKWSDAEINIRVAAPGEKPYYVTIIAVGITGQLRGVNIDDYRPDLIVVDDPCDLENTNTVEARKKMSELFFGGLLPSLNSRQESPHAKIVLLQTCLAKGDLIDLCHKNSMWETVKLGCFDEKGESVWPERKTTAELKAMKDSYTEMGQLSVFLREFECKLNNAETACFYSKNIQYYDVLPEEPGIIRVTIDPASSENKNASRTAIFAAKYIRSDMYVLDYYMARGLNPEETANNFFRICLKYGAQSAGVETVAYQKMLAWYITNKMAEYNCFIMMNEIDDKRKKWDRIRQAWTARVYNKQVFLRPQHTELAQALEEAPDTEYIDLLDAGALNIDLNNPAERAGNVVPIKTALMQDKEKYGELPEHWRIA